MFSGDNMPEKEQEIKKAVSIKLAKLEDLVKLVVSSIMPGERTSGYIGCYQESGKTYFFILNSSLGYYNLNALPIVTWVGVETQEDIKSFIRYRTSPKEELEFSDNASDPKWITLPVIKFEEMPSFLKAWE